MSKNPSLDVGSEFARHLSRTVGRVLKYEISYRVEGILKGEITIESFLAGLFACYKRQTLLYFEGREGFERLFANLRIGEVTPLLPPNIEMTAKHTVGYAVTFDVPFARVLSRAVKIVTASDRRSVEIRDFVASLALEDDILSGLKETWGITIKGIR